MVSKKKERLVVELAKERVPLRQVMHNKNLNDAAQSLKDIRAKWPKLAELEFIHKATLRIKWIDYDTVYLIAERLETDNEYAKRMDELRRLEQQAKERAKRKAEQEAFRAAARKQAQMTNAVKTIADIASANGISREDLDRLMDALLKPR